MAFFASLKPLLYLVPVSAWGRVQEPEPDDDASEEIQDVDPDKECQVCRARVVSIYFVPCKHRLCSGCVDKCRRESIFKVTS